MQYGNFDKNQGMDNTESQNPKQSQTQRGKYVLGHPFPFREGAGG
ncbi:MAG: hypothetical protein JWN14_2527 [Chthonomonadales bacterium]|nr:hypothetical protein [Chthonomonadales bacterium]